MEDLSDVGDLEIAQTPKGSVIQDQDITFTYKDVSTQSLDISQRSSNLKGIGPQTELVEQVNPYPAFQIVQREPLEEMNVVEYRLVLAFVLLLGALGVLFFAVQHWKGNLHKNVWKGVRHAVMLKLLVFSAIRGFAFVVHLHYGVWLDILLLLI